jgi:hypothetical protein
MLGIEIWVVEGMASAIGKDRLVVINPWIWFGHSREYVVYVETAVGCEVVVGVVVMLEVDQAFIARQVLNFGVCKYFS